MDSAFDPPLLAVLLIAPLPYWLVGLPFVAGSGAIRLAPIVGLAIVGWCAEAGMILQAGASLAVLVATALSLTVLLLLICYRRVDWRRIAFSIGEGYFFYLVALVPALASPFPVLGVWSGDWLQMYDAGIAVWQSGAFTRELLERPPLGGATAIPLWELRPGLPSYQLACTVASAALLGVALYAYRAFGGKRLGMVVLIPTAGSVFFLHNTAACWAKPLAAGLIVGGLTLLWQARQDRAEVRWWQGVMCFALSAAVHHSSILHIGFLLVVAAAPWDGWFPLSRRLAVATLFGLLAVAPYELWSAETYGWDAKVQANPSVAQRDANVPFPVNAGLVAVSSIIAWSPLVEIRQFVQSRNVSQALTNGYWLATGYLTVLAGTLAGSMLAFVPLLWCRPAERSEICIPWRPIAWAAGFAFLGNAVLNPFNSPSGSAQTGLVPLQLMILVGLSLYLDRHTARVHSWVDALTVLLGTLPFLLINGLTAAGLKFSSTFRDRFSAGSEGDWSERIVPRQLEPLGLTLFPAGIVVVLGLLLILWWRAFRTGHAAFPKSAETACCSL
jgi:hypothetical protein